MTRKQCLVNKQLIFSFLDNLSHSRFHTRPANGSLSTHACSAAHHQGVTGRCILHAYHMPVRHLVRCRITLYFTVTLYQYSIAMYNYNLITKSYCMQSSSDGVTTSYSLQAYWTLYYTDQFSLSCWLHMRQL